MTSLVIQRTKNGTHTKNKCELFSYSNESYDTQTERKTIKIDGERALKFSV